MNSILSTQNKKDMINDDKNPMSKPDHCEDDYNHNIRVLTHLNKTLKKDEDLANIVRKYTDVIDSEEENKDGGNSTGANK